MPSYSWFFSLKYIIPYIIFYFLALFWTLMDLKVG